MPPAYIRPIVTEEDAVIALPRVIPRTKPTPIPAPSIFDEPTYCFKINKDWAGHFLGAILTSLNQPDTWKPDVTHDVEWARLQVVEWVAKLLTEDMCMPCCDDLVEQITELVEINNTMLTHFVTIVTNLTTIINNQVTQIDNSETIIDNSETVIIQNDQDIITNATNIYNNQVINNSNVTNYNEMIYDGTPQSIDASLGENFNSTGGDDALCGAIKVYTDKIITDYTTRVNLAAVALGVGVTAATTFLTLITGGAALPLQLLALGFLSTTAAGVSNVLWNAIAADSEARLKVRCCMFESLKDQPITQDAFKNAVLDCGFDPTTFEGHIAGLIQNESGSDGNYLAFLRALALNAGNAAECSCCEVILVATNDCVITALGDCRWRIVQTRGEIGPGDPFCGAWTYYPAMFKDQFDRCINVSGVSGTAMTAWVQIDCEDVEHSGVGGGGGEGKHFHWASKACLTYPPYDATYLDIIVEAFLVE